MKRVTMTLVLLIFLAATAAVAKADPTAADICLASKQKAAANYAKCRYGAEMKHALNGAFDHQPLLDKCSAKFAKAWQKAVAVAAAGGATCPDGYDSDVVEQLVRQHTSNLSSALAGSDKLDNCPAEVNVCEGSLEDCTAGVATCSTELANCQSDNANCNENIAQTETALDWCGPVLTSCQANYFARRLKTGVTKCWDAAGSEIACAGTGQDGELQKGVARNYVDHADGTISDTATGLMWERLDNNNANGIHDVDQTYYWYNAFKKIRVLNGDATACIAANNPDACCSGVATGSCSPFAGHSDWRLPNSFELLTLVDYSRTAPMIPPVFHSNCTAGCSAQNCGCTQSWYYWGSDRPSDPSLRQYAIMIGFNDGGVPHIDQPSWSNPVRAVRGGL